MCPTYWGWSPLANSRFRSFIVIHASPHISCALYSWFSVVINHYRYRLIYARRKRKMCQYLSGLLLPYRVHTYFRNILVVGTDLWPHLSSRNRWKKNTSKQSFNALDPNSCAFTYTKTLVLFFQINAFFIDNFTKINKTKAQSIL